jgi:predicted NAD/FAD-binding protein
METVGDAIYEGAANHFMGVESVGGRLYLTADALIFVSHAANIQVHRLTIPIRDIRNVKAVPTLGIVPNGILVETYSGKAERFVVNKRETWITEINKL